MKYNLTKYAQIDSLGSIDLAAGELVNITSDTEANVFVPASGVSGTLVLETDLGARVHIDTEVQYHFDSAQPKSTVASGIKFSYKNEPFEVYTSLNTYYNNDYYYTIVSGTDAPRYIKIEHTIVSGTTGYVNHFKVFNDDTYVDFGNDATQTETNFNLSVENQEIEINELEVYNSGPSTANAKLIIEPQDTAADSVLKISDSVDGPWYGVYEEDNLVAGTGIWDSGEITNLYTPSDILKLSPPSTVGTYKTRVFELSDYEKLNFCTIKYNYPSRSPQTEFSDDFSAAGVNWTVVTSLQSVVDFTLGTLNFYTTPIDYNTTDIRTTKTDYEYSEDFLLSFDYKYGMHYATGNYGQRTYFMWPLNTFYIRNYTNTGNNQTDLHLDGNTYDLSSVWNWADLENTWISVKVRREFTSLKIKFWLTTSGIEPEAWSWEGSVLPEDGTLPLTGGIRIYDYATPRRDTGPYQGHEGYYDNFNLIKNYSSSPNSRSIIATDLDDTLENIEVRSSNSQPLNREAYIETIDPSDRKTKYSWVLDGSTAETTDTWYSYGESISASFWEYWCDSKTEDLYMVDKLCYTGYGGNTKIWFRILRKDGTLISSPLITNSDYDIDCFYNTFKICPDYTGGFWILYFLATSYSSNGNYYLRYYDSNMNQIYNRTATAAQGTFLFDMDAVYESSGYLWYTDKELNTVFKMDKDGSILASFIATEELRGILAADDGGCWFIQDEGLIKLSSDGAYEDVIYLPSDTVSYVYSDLNGGFWLHEGLTVRHLDSEGTETFNIEIPDLYDITPIHSGFITREKIYIEIDGVPQPTTPKASYVSKEHQRIVRTWDYPTTEGQFKGSWDYNKYGVISQRFDDLETSYAFPISIDTSWTNDSNWRKASLRDYTFPNDKYHQIKLTLRADNSSNSPEVEGIYTQTAIEIPNIRPHDVGKFYLKSDVSDLDIEDIGNYTSHVRAYWLYDAE